MAQDTSLEGLRRQIITEKHGRRLGLAPGNAASANNSADYLVGPKAFREQVEGWNAAGTTVVSTSVTSNLSAYGASVVGATGASATTAYILDAPVPGVTKKIFNPTTGGVTILTTASGAFLCSTGSAASTQGTITMLGKGAAIELIGLTTNLWGVMTPITTATTGANLTIA